MSGIPDDILKIAATVWYNLTGDGPDIYDIAKAINAERERCAYIAESIRRENDKGEGFDSHSGRTVAWEIRELITQGAVAAPKGEA